ncbi:MAG: DUF4837 family protein [Bacteroidales bacterium]|jgi:hypothetical protein|nr:DUF4837 family protein [Bacteroidales bacterium]
MKTRKFLIIGLLAALLSGCGNNSTPIKQNISGKAGEIVIVADKKIWENETGSELRKILEKDYPCLPQREPSFTLIHIPQKAFTNIFQIHRNLIICQLDNNIKKTAIVKKEDVWSAPQTVIYVTASDEKKMAEAIKENGKFLYNTMEEAERNRIIRNAKRYEEASIRKTVSGELGGSPFFPTGYSIKKHVPGFFWISYETTYTIQGIFAYKFPYRDSSSLSLNNIISVRNAVMKANVPGMLEGSYMITSPAPEGKPVMKWKTYKGIKFAEVRGLWEVMNDFMGGPFIQHVFLDRSGKNVIVLEGFVYAPRYDKRNYLREVESIIYSFTWENDQRS